MIMWSMLKCEIWWMKMQTYLEANAMKVIIYVKGVLTCTHTHILNEWINEVKECEWKGEFWGDQSLRVEMKCLVATSLPPKNIQM